MMTYQILQWIAVQLRETSSLSLPTVKSRATLQWLRSSRWLAPGGEQELLPGGGVLCPYLPGGGRGWRLPPPPTSLRRPRRSWWTPSRCRPRLTVTTTRWPRATTRPLGQSCWTIFTAVCWLRASMELSHGDPRALTLGGGRDGGDWDRPPPPPPPPPPADRR